MKPQNGSSPELFVDNEPFDWDKETITGREIRNLAGVPDDVHLFRKIPGRPDVFVSDSDVINLDDVKGPDRFYTQCVGSQAG